MNESKSVFPLLTKDEVIKNLASAERPYRDRYLAGVPDVEAEAKRLTARLIQGGSEKGIKVRLKALGLECWPQALMERYKSARRWQDRHSCVFAAIPEARNSEVARELARLALGDRSSTVRWRAHQVLAYGLDRPALPLLVEALKAEKRADLRDSLTAAITAIKEGDHNLYVNREGWDDVGWDVQPWEGDDPAIQRGSLNHEIQEIIEGWTTEF